MNKIIVLFLTCISFGAFAQLDDAELSTNAQQIKNETQPGANSATRIGTMFQDIIDSKVSLLGDYTNPTWLTAISWVKIASTPTTLAGYGITDGATTAYVNAQDAGRQPIDGDLTAIAGLTPSNDDIIQRKAGAWTNRSIAQLKTDLNINTIYTGNGTLSEDREIDANGHWFQILNAGVVNLQGPGEMTISGGQAAISVNSNGSDNVDLTALNDIVLTAGGQVRLSTTIHQNDTLSHLLAHRFSDGNVYYVDRSTLDKFDTWYNVQDYGLVNDGVTDNSAALIAMIALVPNWSWIYFPGDPTSPTKGYNFNSTVTVNKVINFVGDGYGSVLLMDENTTLFNIDAGSGLGSTGYFIIRDLWFKNTNAGTPTSTSIGIRMEGAFNSHTQNVTVEGFYDNIQVLDNAQNIFDGCLIQGYVNAGIYFNNQPPYQDSGDNTITNCYFIPAYRTAIASLLLVNNGGYKISNNKFNYQGGTNNKAAYHIYYNGTATTVDMQIANNSFENYSTAAIRLGAGTGVFEQVTIVGNDFGTGAGNGIVLNGITKFSIVGNSMRAGGSSAIHLTNCSDGIIWNNYTGWTTNVNMVSGNSNIYVPMEYSPSLTISNDDIMQRKSGVWTNRTMAQVKTDLALTKSDVGLGSVDNTTDLGKPISTLTQTALDAKQATLVSGTNIKTINGTSLVGSGNITISGAVSLGTTTQIPFMNSGGTDFIYEAAFTYDGSTNTLDADVVTVDGEVYDPTNWNGDNSAPTKNDVRDKIEALVLGGGGGTPGGSTTQVQYNDTGTFAGEPDFTYDATTNTMTVDVAAVDTEAYDASGWNADLSVPTKDAVRDYLEASIVPKSERTFGVAFSNTVTAITASTAKEVFHFPYTTTISEIWVGLITAQASGSVFTVDVKKNGTTVFSTLITIDNTEETSLTAATAAVISSASFTKGDRIQIDVTQVGNGTAIGGKIYFRG